MKFSLSHRKTNLLSLMSVTNKLIIFTLIFSTFFWILFFIYGQDFFKNNIALTPSLILSGQSLWTFLTSMFAHAGFLHIFANMFSLFFIGNFLEKIIGGKRFFWIYLLSGIFGGIFFVSLAYFGQFIPYGLELFGSFDLSGVGASGAIFGILGVLAVLVPYSRIYLIAGPLIVIIFMVIFPQLSFLGNLIILLMIFAIFSFNQSIRKFAVPIELPMWLLPFVAIIPLLLINFVPGIGQLPIGNSAHIGGLFLGVIYGFYLTKKFPNKTKKISRHFR